MRILTWNINGLATTLQYYPWSEKKSYKVLLDTLNADIICLQEIKTQRQKLTREMAIVPGYDGYFSFSKNKHGYSGVAIYIKQPLIPLTTSEFILSPDLLSSTSLFKSTLITNPPELLDAEGRSLIMDFGFFVLFNIYFPNNGSSDDGERAAFKMDYHHCVRERIDRILKHEKKQVILVGDINSVHEEIDHCDPAQSMKDYGLDHFKDLPHRRWLDQLISPNGPLIDTCRLSHPNRQGMFTCWNTKINARPSNYGTRIDYILISEGLLPWFKQADIQPEIVGSDHCPVYMDLVDTLENDPEIKLHDMLMKHHPSPSPTISTSPLLTANFSEFKQHKLSAFFGKQTNTKPASSPPSPFGKKINELQLQQPITTATSFDSTQSPNNIISTLSSSKKRKSISSLSNSNGNKRQTIASYFGNTQQQKSTIKDSMNNNSDNNNEKEKEDKEKVEDDQLIDIDTILSQIEEREQVNKVWNSLFQPKSLPKCRIHQENCIELTVNKKGPNQGRKFYLCSRPVGPQNTTNQIDYRCNFFQWKHEKK
ncbi:Endonuclease/exonuclease/phosphatase [Cunninghamella echinulata]|nr:Endonuclease/exonuclease/phosphatase [Cunninghamella echinulata]